MWQVIGQNRAVSLLKRSLEIGAVSHAYLFTGPAHVGKMTLAINLAQAVNCEVTEAPCGQCDSCQKIASAKHADVQILDLNRDGDSAEGENRVKIGVGQIEELQHAANLPPFEGKYKVFIINGADLLSIAAANRLLKTLEEPVDRVIFILLTTSEQLLPVTVISRCQRVQLLPLATVALEDILKSRWGIEAEKARLLATVARGCPGWALSAIQDDRLLQQRDQYLDELLDIIDTGIEERFSYVARLATQFHQNRGLVQEKLNLWLDWWRDLLLVTAGSSDMVYNIDRLDTLEKMTGDYDLRQIRKYVGSIQAAFRQLAQNANPQLVLEVLMLEIPEQDSRAGSGLLPRLR